MYASLNFRHRQRFLVTFAFLVAIGMDEAQVLQQSYTEAEGSPLSLFPSSTKGREGEVCSQLEHPTDSSRFQQSTLDSPGDQSLPSTRRTTRESVSALEQAAAFFPLLAAAGGSSGGVQLGIQDSLLPWEAVDFALLPVQVHKCCAQIYWCCLAMCTILSAGTHGVLLAG